MATTLKTLPKFVGLTASQYSDLQTKDSNTLYFVYDSGSNGVLYRGSHVFGESIEYVSQMPEAASALYGVVYFNQNTGVAYIKKNASTVTPIGVTTISAINDSDPSQNGEVPNIGAVKAYVKSKIATVFTYKGVVATVDDLPELELSDDETADVVAGKTYYRPEGGGVYTILDLNVGETVPAGTYEGPKVGDIYNVITDTDGTSAEYAWTAKEVGTAPDTHIEYGWEKLGTTIDYSVFMSKATGATSGNIAIYGQNGQVADSSINYTTASDLATVTNAHSSTLVNELAVAKASSALNTSITNASSTLSGNISAASSALSGAIVTASEALSGAITAASAALSGAKMDKVASGSANIVLISTQDGNASLSGKTIGSGAIYSSGNAYIGSSTVIATEEAVVSLINQMAWTDVSAE